VFLTGDCVGPARRCSSDDGNPLLLSGGRPVWRRYPLSFRIDDWSKLALRSPYVTFPQGEVLLVELVRFRTRFFLFSVGGGDAVIKISLFSPSFPEKLFLLRKSSSSSGRPPPRPFFLHIIAYLNGSGEGQLELRPVFLFDDLRQAFSPLRCPHAKNPFSSPSIEPAWL